MHDKVTLKILGDLKLFKKHMTQNDDINRRILFILSNKKDEPHTVEFTTENNSELLCGFLNILAEYIIEHYEPQMAERIMLEDYSYLSNTQKRTIMRSLSDLDEDEEVGYSNRRQAIFESLLEYVQIESAMLLNGFIMFRLKAYEELLRTLVHYLTEDIITQEEYNNFIDLLKYFVNIQEARPNQVHILIDTNGQYELFSENEENITERCMSDFVDTHDLPQNINYDDLLISMLITLAPKSIIVHNSNQIKNKELFKTIDLVFDKNVVYSAN